MSRILRLGLVGADVKALQHALNARPYIKNLKEDGRFGPKTEAALREFQKRTGYLKPDGKYGPLSEAAMWTRVATVNVVVQAPISNAPNPTPKPNVNPPPVPPPAPGPPPAPSSGAGIVQQVGVGGQVSLAPWLLRPAAAPGTPSGPVWSGLLSYSLVYRTKSEGPHVEFALNPQFLVNSRVQATDPRFALQVNGQVTFADLVTHSRFHLISPFVQATGAFNAVPGGSFGGGFAIGNQVSFDLISDRLQITLQTGLAAQWVNLGRPDAAFSVLGQGAIGTTIQF